MFFLFQSNWSLLNSFEYIILRFDAKYLQIYSFNYEIFMSKQRITCLFTVRRNILPVVYVLFTVGGFLITVVEFLFTVGILSLIVAIGMAG